MTNIDVNDLWNDPLWNDIEFEEVRNAYLHEFLPQTLDSPILIQPLLKLQMAMSGRADDRLRGKISLKVERAFLDEVVNILKIRLTDTDYKLYNPKDSVTIIHDILASIPPKDLETLIPEVLYQTLSETINKRLGCNLQLPGLISDITKVYYGPFCFLRKCYDIRRSKSSKGLKTAVAFRRNGITLVLSSLYCAWNSINLNKTILMSLNVFIMILDIVRLRFSCHLSIDVLKPDPKEYHSSVEEIFSWQFRVIEAYGNDGYELIKAPEALFKCYVSRISGGSYKQPDAFSHMLDKIRNKERKLIASISLEHTLQDDSQETPMTEELKQIILSQVSIENCVELFGCIKFSGFPVIDPAVGGASARIEAQRPMEIQCEPMVDCWRMFKHLFLVNYLQKEGKWPALKFYDKKVQLRTLYDENWLSLTVDDYPLSDWDTTQYNMLFELDFYEDYMLLIQDKACAPPASLVQAFYDRGQGMDKKLRRLLHVMMSQTKIDTRDLLFKFAKDLLSPDEFVILLYPKEKEFKPAARMFCMMTFSIRLIFTIIQENVKDHVFPMLPYQSMTLDQTSLTHQLLRMTHGCRANETLFIEVDFSRWNLCFRDVFLKGFGDTLDQMFGVTNIFGRTTEFFSKSTITVLVQDARVPQRELGSRLGYDSDMEWKNHYGGFEGIDQATMTLATIAMIFVALKGEKCTFILLGQGDNQTLAITRLTSEFEDLSTFSARVMKKIEITASSLNHTAKPEEFIDSTKVLTYSKIFIVNGSIIPMELKFAANIAPITATEIPSVGDAIGSIFATAVSSAQNALYPLLHWYLALVHSYDTVLRFKSHGAWFHDYGLQYYFSSLSDDTIKLILLIPSVIGGFPIVGWGHFISRHDPDPLVSAIACLRWLSQETSVCKYLSYLQTEKPYHSKDIDLKKLLIDPASLPFKNPPTQKSTLSAFGENELTLACKNQDIKSIISCHIETSDELARSITSMTPMYPSLAHDLWKISIAGKHQEFCEMFTLTRSIIESTKQSQGIHSSLIKAEARNVESVIGRFRESHLSSTLSIPASALSYNIAEKLRLRWQLSVPMQGMTVTHPLDYNFCTPESLTNGVRLSIDYELGSNPLADRGPYKPFISGKTFERRVGKQYEVRKAPGILELQKMVSLVTAGGVGDTMRELASETIKTRTRFSLTHLEEIFPRTIGGILAHRYEMFGSDARIGPVGNVTFSTHTLFNSDSIEGVSGGKDDYPIAFQLFHAYLISFSRIIVSNGNPQSSRMLICELTNRDLPILVQEEIVVKIPFKYKCLPVEILRNPLVFIQALEYKQRVRDVDRTIGTHIMPEKLITKLSSLKRLVISLFVSELSSRGEHLQQFDVESRVDQPLPLIDALVFDKLSLGLIIDCSSVAVAILTVTSFYLQPSRSRSQMVSILTIIDKLSQLVTSMWRHHLTRVGANLTTNIGSNQIVRTLGGSSAGRLTSSIIRTVRHIAFSFLSKPTKRLTIPLIAIARGPIKLIGSYLGTVVARSFWFLRCSLKDPNSIDQLARSAMMMIRLASLRDTTEDVVAFQILSKITESFGSVISDRIVSFIIRHKLSGHLLVDLSPVELWRLLRNVDLRSLTPLKVIKVTEPQRIYDISSTCYSHTLKRVGMQAVLKPESIGDNNSFPTVHEKISQRLGLEIGLFSTAGNYWAGLLSDLEGPVLVLGTGAGGIQSMLASYNIPSIGFDLSSLIPPDVKSSGLFYPPECSRHNNTIGKYSDLMFTKQVDILTQDGLAKVLFENSYSLVIWDLEYSTHRDLFRPFDILYKAGYVGVCFVKLFLTQTELNHMTSYLVSIRKGFFQDVFQLSSRHPNERTAPVAFKVNFDTRLSFPPDCPHWFEVQLRWGGYPTILTNPYNEYSQLIDLMIGSLTPYNSNLLNMLDLLREYYIMMTSSARGRLHSGDFIALVVGTNLLSLFLTVSNEPLNTLGDLLVKYHIEGYQDSSLNHKTTIRSVGYEQHVVKTIPRLVHLKQKYKL
nr:MAG: RNA-dependent RNA polymerase [XiangYun mono-chu-like virus 7]